jgi:LCP family protein required for cell wall assembly
VLVLGIDETNHADAVMVVTYNSVTNRIDAVSVPRDLRIQLSASEREQLRNDGRGTAPANGLMRVNELHLHAGASNGPRYILNHLSTLLNIKIDYYATFELSSFRDIVDSIVGGVLFTLDEPLIYEDAENNIYINVPAGTLLRNGRAAEGIMRYSSSYPQADLDRIDVQQRFLRAMFEQAFTRDNVKDNVFTSIRATLNFIRRTDFTYDKLLRYTDVVGSLGTALVTFHLLPGEVDSTGYYYDYDHDEGKNKLDGIFGR